MKKFLLSLFAFCVVAAASAQFPVLNPEARIYLLTCQPGTEVYATFGHTAIYVDDATQNINYVFNYGIFSFDADNFLYNFVKGNTYYILGVDTYDHFLRSYGFRQMGVSAQELNLNPDEKNKLFRALLINALPENREYLYNFFYDNCSTRARDVIEKSIDGKLIIPPSGKTESYRDLVAMFTGKNTWLKFGIDFLIGAPADEPITDYQKMFLPYFLRDDYDNAVIEKNGEQTPLVTGKEVLVPDFEHKAPGILTSPLVVMWLVFIITLFVSIMDFRRKKLTVWFNFIFFFITGVVGIVVFFVSFLSIHPTVFPNYNILWLHPLHLVFAILLLFKNIRSKLWGYDIFNIAIIVVAIVMSIFCQSFNAAFYPLMLAFALRSATAIAVKKMS